MPVASLERIIRPRVLPRIRPAAPTQALSDEDDSGVARITGGAQLITLSHSYSSSQTRQSEKEIKRKFDKIRVKQIEDDGTVNEDNFVDVEALHKLETRDGRGLKVKYNLEKPPPGVNIDQLEEDVWRSAESS